MNKQEGIKAQIYSDRIDNLELYILTESNPKKKRIQALNMVKDYERMYRNAFINQFDGI